VALASIAVGFLYLFIVPPGLPSDEPSHWATVQFFLHHAAIPVLGHPGVTYEAQQGPVAYVVDAAILNVARGVGMSPRAAFDAVRAVGLAELAVASVILYAIVRRLRVRPVVVAAAVAFFAVNPMLLTMSASVQNDGLALVCAFAALLATLEWLSENPSSAVAAGIGVVAGLAILTKLTAAFIVPAIVAWLAWRHRRTAIQPIVGMLLAVAVTSGWWFVRNVVLYGDPTAAKAVSRAGVTFPPYHVQGVGAAGHIAEEVVTYLWLPTEYLRNYFHASSSIKLAVVALTALILAASLPRLRQIGFPGLILTSGVVTVVGWLLIYLFFQAGSPRLAYTALPLWIALLAVSLDRLSSRTVVIMASLILVGLNIWTLSNISRVKHPPRLVSDGPPYVSALGHVILRVE
jgi:D-alanyl-D-alanine carboxypeptidase (penicillin-binding protein 5/6)